MRKRRGGVLEKITAFYLFNFKALQELLLQMSLPSVFPHTYFSTCKKKKKKKPQCSSAKTKMQWYVRSSRLILTATAWKFTS